MNSNSLQQLKHEFMVVAIFYISVLCITELPRKMNVDTFHFSLFKGI